MLFELSKGIIQVATFTGEAYYESQDGVDSIVMTSEEKLQTMNIDNLVSCYDSTTQISNYSSKKAEQFLMNNYLSNHFLIKDIIIRENCIYLKIVHAIPFKDVNKCYGTSFSINYMKPNNCVSVYGSITKNANEKQAFKEIANELITALLK